MFFSTLAVYAFVAGTAKGRVASGQSNERNAPWAGQTRFEPSWTNWALTYAAMGCGVLVKGPVAVVLPTAVVGLFLLVMRARPSELPAGDATLGGWRVVLRRSFDWLWRVFSPLHVLRTIWSMRPLTAVAMVLAVAGPWFVWVGLRTDGEFLVEFFGVHNFGRFLGPMENHRGPIFYYLLAIAVWVFSLVSAGRPEPGCASQPGGRKRSVAAWLCAGSGLAGRVGRVLFAGRHQAAQLRGAGLSGLALFTGAFVDRWQRVPAAVPRIWLPMIWGTVTLVGIGMLVALPIVGRLYLHGDWVLALVGLIPLAAAVVGFARSRQCGAAGGPDAGDARRHVHRGSAGLCAAHVDRYQDSPWVADGIAMHTPSGEQAAIGSFNYFRPSFVFYTGRPVAEFESTDDVQSFFASHPGTAFIVTTEDAYRTLAPTLPTDVTVLDRHPRFLRPGDALLLGRGTHGRHCHQIVRSD